VLEAAFHEPSYCDPSRERRYRLIWVIVCSDVKCHEIFCLEIFHEIFEKFHDVFSGFIHSPVEHFLYVKHYLSFIYAYCSSLSLSAGLLAWFACLSRGLRVVIKLGLSSDYYDVRGTRYSPVAVTELDEVKEGSVSSTGTRTVL